MNYRQRLKKAISALRPLQDKDPVYSDCISHLEAEILKHPPQQKETAATDNDQSAADDYLDYLDSRY